MRDTDHIVNLLKKYLENKEELSTNDELQKLFIQHPSLLDFVRELNDEKGIGKVMQQYGFLNDKKAKRRETIMLDRILEEIHQVDHKESKPKNLWRYISAASVVVIFCVALWATQTRSNNPIEQLVETSASFTPGTNKAVLTLSNGKTLELSSDHERIIVGSELTYDNGDRIVERTNIDEVSMMTLTTPRGGQYQIVLPDGSKVWLNADTKLSYPSKFVGRTRIVQLEGEAYFEVAQNKEKPFIVHTAKEKVEVLGTHFNLNSYTEEVISSVVLLEGKVKVTLPNHTSEILKPGQQSVIEKGAMRLQSVEVSESVAWKNGKFSFNNESLESVMRKLSRWYDIQVVLPPDLENISIWGSISRYDSFDKVMEIVKMTDKKIKFKIEGRTIIFMK